MSPLTDEDRASPAPRRRRKLWEVPASLHGPLLCICMTTESLARLAGNPGTARGRDELEWYGEILERVSGRNPASEALQRHLEKTHRLWVDRFALVADDASVLDRWRTGIRRGEIAGPLWAACTHRAVSEHSLRQIDGDLRALSCRLDVRPTADAQRLAFLESEAAQLRAELCRLKIRHAGEIDSLRQELNRLERSALPRHPAPSLHDTGPERKAGVRRTPPSISPRSGTAGSSAA